MGRLACALGVLAVLAALWALWPRSGHGPRAAPPAAYAPAPEVARPAPDERRAADEPAPDEALDEPVEDLLPEEGLLLLRVVDADGGAPLRDVRVERDDGTLLGTTGPDGRVEAVLDRPSVPITARRDGYAVAHHVAGAGIEETVELTAAELSLRGRVLWHPSRMPVDGAHVRVWDLDAMEEVSGTIVTGPEGGFEVPGVRAHHPLRIVAALPGRGAGTLEHSFEADVRDLEILVPGDGLLEGTVTVRGTPREGLEVFLLRPGAPIPAPGAEGGFLVLPEDDLARFAAPRAVTDALGRYEIRGIAAGEELQPVVRISEEFDWPGEPARFAGEGERHRRDIAVPLPASLRVRAFGADGRLQRKVQVDLENDRNRFTRGRDDAEKDGSRRFAAVTPASYTLNVWFEKGGFESLPVELAPGDARDVEVRLRAGLVLEGVVVTTDGEPIPGADVWYAGGQRAHGSTDAQGRFRLEGLDGGPGRVSVHAFWPVVLSDSPPLVVHGPRYFVPAVLTDVRPGGEPLRIELEHGARVTGRLTGVPADLAEADCRVICEAFDSRVPWALRNGGWFEGVVPSRVPFTLVFQFPGRGRAIRDLEPLEPRAVLDLGEIAPAAFRTTRGVVTGADGTPVARARVILVEPWSAGEVATRTDGNGAFRLPKMPPKPFHLRIEADGHPAHLFVLDRDGETLVLGPGGVLRGAVLGVEGAVHLRVQAVAPGFHRDSTWNVYRADAGRPFELRLQPGAYRITASLAESQRFAETEVTVTAGDTTEVVLRPGKGK